MSNRETYCVSYVDRRSIIGQQIVNGRLITEFRADPDIDQPGGTLCCEQPTEEEKKRLREQQDPDDLHCAVLSETVTRFGTLFWDRGVFTPRV